MPIVPSLIRLRTACLIAAGFAILFAPNAIAGVTYSATGHSSDGSPLSALTTNARITIDITIRADDIARGVSASASGYDDALIRFSPVQVYASRQIFSSTCSPLPSVGCSGGLTNIATGSVPIQERQAGPGPYVQFLAGVGIVPAQGDGSQDLGVVTGVPGDPQFRLVFDWIGGVGETTIHIGSFSEYGDSYIGTVDNNVTNTSITLAVVPEPGTTLLLGLGLVFLGTHARAREHRA